MDAKKFNELVKNFKNDSKAFMELYNYYFPKIILFIFRRYGSKEMGKDVAHDFFAERLKNEVKNYIENPSAWVYTSCDNVAKKYLLEEKYNDLAYVKEPTTEHDSVFNKVVFDEYLNNLDKLDNESANIVFMCAYLGYSLKEIADKMNLNHNTVRQKYSRGIKKLRKF